MVRNFRLLGKQENQVKTILERIKDRVEVEKESLEILDMEELVEVDLKDNMMPT